MIANTNNVSFTGNLLEDRERRAIYQQHLLKTHNHTLVVIKPNYPGSLKHNAYTTTTTVLMSEAIKAIIGNRLLYQDWQNTSEGLIGYFITSIDGFDCKRSMMDLEDNHSLGRLVDIDVMTQEKYYHRSDFHAPPRPCFICQEDARLCARSAKHSLDIIEAFYINQVESFCAQRVEITILFALLAEVNCHPKFGLVTPFSNGSHSDMDFFAFVRSSIAIAPLLAQATTMSIINAEGNRLPHHQIFDQLRTLGQQIEHAMFTATSGINTHKGAIFLFLLLLMGSRMASEENASLNASILHIKKLSKALTQDWDSIYRKNKEELSHGESLYKEFGLLGARGLALSGMEELFIKYLPFFQNQTGTLNERMVQTLLLLIEHCEDTTVLHRGGIEGWKWLQAQAKQTRENRNLRSMLDQESIARHLSPGGSADLLSLIVYLDVINRRWKGEKTDED